MKKNLLFAVIGILLLGFCFGFSRAKSEQFPIRVAILTDAQSFIVSTSGPYRIIDALTGKEVYKGRRLRQQRFQSKGGQLYFGLKPLGLEHIKIFTRKEITVYKDRKKSKYRGSLDVLLDKQKELLVINTLDLERYIKGVLFHEVSHRWPISAIKAQAVAARTYAVYQADINKDRLYDVTNDIYSQVYGGRDSERFRTNIAANRTRNEVLIFRKKILPAYYHSNSGGYTEDASELWQHDLLPLKGVKDPYSVGMPSYKWKKNFQSKMLQDKLNENGYNIDLIKSIKITQRSQSGRVKEILIESRKGKKIILSGKKFRNILGPNNVRSSLYDVVMKGYYFDLVGKGWGHGVGMSQWGAYRMSRLRKDYREILEFYYPQAEIVDLTKWQGKR